jgi:hypothetical protein
VQKPVAQGDAGPRDAAVAPDASLDAAVATRRPHAIHRKDLTVPDVDVAKLPAHGVVLAQWYLGGDSLTVVDFDTATLRYTEHTMMSDEKPANFTRKLKPAQLDRLRSTGLAAWDEEPKGDMPHATDIRQDLVVLDGDEAFYLSGYPISTGLGEATGRPAASAAVVEILSRIQPR